MKMVNYCFVFNCKNNTKNSKRLSFFSIPSDTKSQMIWLPLIGREEWILRDPKAVTSKRVCSVHFSPNLISGIRLKKNAVPDIFDDGVGFRGVNVNVSTSAGSSVSREVLKEAIQDNIENVSANIPDPGTSETVVKRTTSESTPRKVALQNEVQRRLSTVSLKDVDQELGRESHEIEAVPEKYQEICRTCLNKNGLLNLFENKHNELLFSDLFTMFSLLELDSTDELPKKICDTCAEIVIQFYMFKERIHQSQIILQDVLNKNSIPANEEEVTEENADDQNDDTDLDTNEIKSNYYCNDNSDSDCDSDKSEVKLYDPSSNEITCTFCNLKFNSYANYLTHRRKEAELRRKKEPCVICNKVISTYKLKDHLNSHTKEAPYECEECGEKYRFRSSLYRHKFVHKEKKPHVCHICGKGFIQAPTLTDHIRTHYSEKSFICNICGKTFITKHALTNHIYMHKSDKLADLNDLTCKNCDKMFTAAHTFNRHMLTHCDKTFLCSQCGKKFATKSLLKQHQKLHSEIKPYICDICNKSFAQKNSLLKHTRTHSGEKSHVCVICDKTFSQKGHLTYHIRTHSGEKPYNCSYCDKAFSHSGSYKVHLRIHTGDRPYICDVCDKGFYDSSSMKKHRKIHESSISNNSYNKTTN
ncbi:unnamed protein product [Psylliodes chrysocephalus]|uniref:Uncharacterized protein n=1 Tax=Psylliodes chrysocephalus TaxID=3402493 RepID=A0A9P0CQ51_9CUCU|nr:unnamed protein product [Psylliodes chrysocephala]